jgi:hypothetical protein
VLTVDRPTAAEEDLPDQKWHQQIRWALVGLNRQAVRVRNGDIPEIAPDALLLNHEAFHRHRRLRPARDSGSVPEVSDDEDAAELGHS